MPQSHRFSQIDTEISTEVFSESPENTSKKCNFLPKNTKIVILITIWAFCCCALMTNNVKIQHMHQISIPKGDVKGYVIMETPIDSKLHIQLQGAFLPTYYGNLSVHWISVWIQLLAMAEPPLERQIQMSDIILLQNISEVWYVPLVSETLIDTVPELKYQKTFNLSSIKMDNTSFHLLKVQLATNLRTNLPIFIGYNLQPINKDNGIIYAALILFGLYLLIIFEVIHRTLAAMLASTTSLAVLTALNARPTMAEIVLWIDIETLLLLFSMMILVTILGETGVFDYMSVLAYKVTQGQVWPLINALCATTALLSCFLDNVTTTLLITPVTIKLCEVMKLNPVPILIFMLIFANLGGAVTPIGDPPNVIIASNADVINSGVNFGVFTMHMGIGVLLALLAIYVQLRLVYSNVSYFKYSEPSQVQDLRREIAVLQRAAASLGSYSKDEEIVKETLKKRSASLLDKLSYSLNNKSEENYNINLMDLERRYPIRDKKLLIKSSCTLLLVICVFFLHSIPALSKMGLGLTAFLGGLLLLLLYDRDDIEGIFERVEWSTLLFFASLFILMNALSRLGLIEWIGIQTQHIIMSVGQESRLTVAILLILWVSGLASAFVDNLPLTTMMVRIVTKLADNHELNLPLPPLIWALSFGACFGGNGTLFGSSSNIVCAGVVEQHGYKFTFLDFMKVGLPIMFTSMLVITFYLITCHVVLKWH